MARNAIATNLFGAGRVRVSCVGLGGEGILRTVDRTREARDVILEALSQGITYFDSARVYADSECYYGSVRREFPERWAGMFQASKSASRDRKGALVDLQQTLDRLGTSYLDLWQIHDVRTEADLRQIAGPGGALEAFMEAKASGKVRNIGVTGHHDPDILTRAVEAWPVDAVMMPVNPAEKALGGFLTSTLSAARGRGIAVIAMKVLGASHFIRPESGVTPDLLIRYALAQGPTVAIVGCSTPPEVRALAGAGASETPLSETAQADLVRRFAPHAARLAYYRGRS